MSHYSEERADEIAASVPKVADMTPAEALALIRARCPAREWNVVLESNIYQYAGRWLGQPYEQPPRDPEIRYACTVWMRDDKQHRGDGKTLRDAVNEALALLPPMPTACELKLISMEGVA